MRNPDVLLELLSFFFCLFLQKHLILHGSYKRTYIHMTSCSNSSTYITRPRLRYDVSAFATMSPPSLRPFRQLQQSLQVNTLRPLDRQSQRPIPDQLRQRPQPARDAKGGGVVERFVKAVVVEEHAGAAVHVGEGILRLAVFLQHGRCDFRVESDELEDG